MLVLAAAAAGCGGGERTAPPRLPEKVAADLAARSDAVAQRLESGDACGARAEAEALQAEAIAVVNERRVPARFQEELVASAAALVASVECAPAPAAAAEDEDEGKRKGNHEEDEEEEDD